MNRGGNGGGPRRVPPDPRKVKEVVDRAMDPANRQGVPIVGQDERPVLKWKTGHAPLGTFFMLNLDARQGIVVDPETALDLAGALIAAACDTARDRGFAEGAGPFIAACEGVPEILDTWTGGKGKEPAAKIREATDKAKAEFNIRKDTVT